MDSCGHEGRQGRLGFEPDSSAHATPFSFKHKKTWDQIYFGEELP
jgi:hypothetical protein